MKFHSVKKKNEKYLYVLTCVLKNYHCRTFVNVTMYPQYNNNKNNLKYFKKKLSVGDGGGGTSNVYTVYKQCK
jgi:5,10-methylenetetrahydrofolate reductase